MPLIMFSCASETFPIQFHINVPSYLCSLLSPSPQKDFYVSFLLVGMFLRHYLKYCPLRRCRYVAYCILIQLSDLLISFESVNLFLKSKLQYY